MGNCLNLFSFDEPDLLSLLPSPSASIAPNMKRLSSAEFHGASPLKLRFTPLLPFRTPSDLAALYELGPELGRGQFGLIRKCTNRASGTLFACKSISKLRLRTIHDIKDVVSEINIMKRLSNRMPPLGKCLSNDMPPHGGAVPVGCNVIRLHEVIEDSSFVHLIMELCSGGELFDRIVKMKCFPEAQVALLMKSLLETLQFCHSMGIMHRDLKPENVLFVEDSNDSAIKLADFGLALEFSPGQKFSGMAGSAYYVAPEVLHGEYSEEVDMWSAGVIMYVLLSGVPPFWGHTEQGIFNAIQEGQLDLTSEPWQMISSLAKDLITQMLCVDVKLRWTPAQALEHPWIINHTTKTSKPFPSLIMDQSQDMKSKRDVESISDSPASFRDEEHENTQSLGSVATAVLVNLGDSTVLDLVESDCTKAKLNKLMVALVTALDVERLSFSESLSKVRLQAGWTCTLLTTSATEETLMVDMGQEKYLIAHDRVRRRLGWKVLKPQHVRRIGEKVMLGYPLGKLQPVF